MTHICVSKLTCIASNNGLSPGRRQAIIWTNAGILLIGPLRTNFSEILIEIQIFSFKKMHLKISSGKCRPSCFGHNVWFWSVTILLSLCYAITNPTFIYQFQCPSRFLNCQFCLFNNSSSGPSAYWVTKQRELPIAFRMLSDGGLNKSLFTLLPIMHE